MQYKIGTVSVTNGSQIVTGLGTLWLANLVAGALFTIPGDNVTYEVATVDSDTQVTLNANYAGTTDSGLTYAMHRDFTSGNIPLLSNNDIETGTIFSRAMAQIQDFISTILAIKSSYSGNGIYNGIMTISQRGDFTSATAATNGVYYLDRWKSFIASITANIQDTSGWLKYIATSTASGELAGFQQIENVNFYKGKTVTFSAKVKSNNTDTHIYVHDGTSYIDGTFHTGGGGEEILSVTVTLGSGISSLGMGVYIGAAGGGAVSITSGDYIEFTDVRLDLGEYRLSGDRELGEELALCQRYWWKPTVRIAATAVANGRTHMSYVFPVTMRSIPSGSFTDMVGNISKVSTIAGNNITLSAGGMVLREWGFEIEMITPSGSRDSYVWIIPIFDAEL